MHIFTAPDTTPEKIDLFLAGGISNCPDWQQETLDTLQQNLDIVVANPRRTIYDDKANAVKQIEWEYEALNKAEVVSFWFPHETLCPITLFELGRFSHDKTKSTLVGVHPQYQRKLDIEVQLRLARPEIEIVYSLQDLNAQIVDYFQK
jgi:hypothetical protein